MSLVPTLASRSQPEKIEDGIVRALQSGLDAKYLIDAFPEDPKEYDFGNAAKVALVQYTGSRYSAPQATSGGSQERRAEFAVHLYFRPMGLVSRGIREVEKVRLIVQGLRVEGTEFQISRDGLVGRDDAMWYYLVEVSCRVPAVARRSVEPASFINNFHQAQGA